MVKVVLAFLCGIIVMSIMFGLVQVLASLIDKVNILKIIKRYLMQIISLVFTIIMYSVVKIDNRVFKLSSLLNIKYYIYIMIIVLIVVSIVAMNNRNYSKMKLKEKVSNCFEGMTMEIPQRLFMQTFLYIITGSIEVSIILNSIIWCTGIFIQAVLFKLSMDKEFFREEISSFIFSIGIGYVFAQSECIILSMIAHAFERYLAQYIREIKNKE